MNCYASTLCRDCYSSRQFYNPTNTGNSVNFENVTRVEELLLHDDTVISAWIITGSAVLS